jgi:hypothetical protein
MKKPNWVCSTCSMLSSRKSSVKRHIQNIHRGNSNLVSFIDYLAGRKSGFYFPAPRPTLATPGNCMCLSKYQDETPCIKNGAFDNQGYGLDHWNKILYLHA